MHNQPTDLQTDPFTSNSLSTNNPQITAPDIAPRGDPVKLHPVDQQTLELTGELPDLPLLVSPEILRSLRGAPSSVHTIETSFNSRTEPDDSPDGDNPDIPLDENGHRVEFTYRGYLLKPRIATYRRALEIYAAVDGSFAGKFSLRLQSCRKYAIFVQNKVTHKLRVQSSRCKLRWCPICRDVSRMIITSATET